jgi:hypothetical protein
MAGPLGYEEQRVGRDGVGCLREASLGPGQRVCGGRSGWNPGAAVLGRAILVDLPRASHVEQRWNRDT